MLYPDSKYKEMTDKTGKIDGELSYLDTMLFNKILVLAF